MKTQELGYTSRATFFDQGNTARVDLFGKLKLCENSGFGKNIKMFGNAGFMKKKPDAISGLRKNRYTSPNWSLKKELFTRGPVALSVAGTHELDIEAVCGDRHCGGKDSNMCETPVVGNFWIRKYKFCGLSGVWEIQGQRESWIFEVQVAREFYIWEIQFVGNLWIWEIQIVRSLWICEIQDV